MPALRLRAPSDLSWSASHWRREGGDANSTLAGAARHVRRVAGYCANQRWLQPAEWGWFGWGLWRIWRLWLPTRRRGGGPRRARGVALRGGGPGCSGGGAPG